jgi:hypothetical protein
MPGGFRQRRVLFEDRSERPRADRADHVVTGHHSFSASSWLPEPLQEPPPRVPDRLLEKVQLLGAGLERRDRGTHDLHGLLPLSSSCFSHPRGRRSFDSACSFLVLGHLVLQVFVKLFQRLSSAAKLVPRARRACAGPLERVQRRRATRPLPPRCSCRPPRRQCRAAASLALPSSRGARQDVLLRHPTPPRYALREPNCCARCCARLRCSSAAAAVGLHQHQQQQQSLSALLRARAQQGGGNRRAGARAAA